MLKYERKQGTEHNSIFLASLFFGSSGAFFHIGSGLENANLKNMILKKCLNLNTLIILLLTMYLCYTDPKFYHIYFLF